MPSKSPSLGAAASRGTAAELTSWVKVAPEEACLGPSARAAQSARRENNAAAIRTTISREHCTQNPQSWPLADYPIDQKQLLLEQKQLLAIFRLPGLEKR